MDQVKYVPLWVRTCPDCGIRITLEGELRIGRYLVCPNCDMNLGLIGIALSTFDWAPERATDKC